MDVKQSQKLLQSCPKMAHIYVGLHCNVKEKPSNGVNREKGQFTEPDANVTDVNKVMRFDFFHIIC